MCLARNSRPVVHSHLDHTCSAAGQLDDQLGVDQVAIRVDLDLAQDPTIEELEGAIDVPDRDVEKHPHQEVPARRHQSALGRVLAVQPVSGDYVDQAYEGEEPCDLRYVELEVSAGEEDEFEPAGEEARAQCPPVAPVLTVADHTHPGIPVG